MATNLSTRQAAELLGVDTWRIQRIFEDGELPDVERFAGKRIIPSTMLPQVIDALRRRDWLPDIADLSGRQYAIRTSAAASPAGAAMLAEVRSRKDLHGDRTNVIAEGEKSRGRARAEGERAMASVQQAAARKPV